MIELAVPSYVHHVCTTLRRAGAEAYVVGGGVRDALLGREPKDWDVATDASPDKVQQLFPRTVPTGIRFGTVAVLVQGDETLWTVEVTTFRGDGDYGDGRRPDEVHFLGRIEDDLVRRDFTVNAIAYDPYTKDIVDPYGGRDDLIRRRLRAVGDADTRFQEDGLRVMRAVRLATELRFDIESETGRAIRRNAEILRSVSRERIGEEWRRILLSCHPGRGLILLAEHNVLPFVLPAREAGSGGSFLEQPLSTVGAALDRAPSKDLVVRTAIVCHGLGGPEDHRRWLKHLVYPKRTTRDVLHVTEGWARFAPESMKTDGELRRFLSGLGRERIGPFLSALRAWYPHGEAASWIGRAEDVLAAGHPLHPRELALNGLDVQRIVPGVSGPAIGGWIERLFQYALEHPEANTAEGLRTLLSTWATEEATGSMTPEGEDQ